MIWARSNWDLKFFKGFRFNTLAFIITETTNFRRKLNREKLTVLQEQSTGNKKKSGKS